MKFKSLILGEGYVGRFLREALVDAAGTHRQRDIPFDLSNRSTWNNLPTVPLTYWLFSPEDPLAVRDFLAAQRHTLGHIVVLGTTSYYQDLNEVTESSPGLVTPRSECEGILRAQGATILRSTGIIGPGRSPFRWLEAGRIQQLRKRVNFVDVDDLVNYLLACSTTQFAGQEFIAHGFTEVWSNIAALIDPPHLETAQTSFDTSPKENGKIEGKTVNNQFSREILNVKVKFNDIAQFRLRRETEPHVTQ